jgi:Tol biopolymer transport system component
MKLLTATTVMAVLLLAAAPQQKQDRAEVALRAAMDKEMVDGDLKAAIEMYKRIVANPGGNRAVAAKALLQMGQCYEKLGQADARKAYERLVREFADQTEQVQVARAKLAALGESRSSTAGSAMTVRKVWSLTASPLAASSPDGRYLSFVDWETGDLAVRDLRTGENRRLTNKGTWKESPEFALFSRWSPDNKQIAYDWYGGGNSDELRIVSLENAKPRILYKSNEGEWLLTCDWSPDGRNILVNLSRENRSSRLAIISIADGALRVLKMLDHGGWPARFSPDSRYVVYSRPPRAGVHEDDIFLLSLADGSETPLVQHPAHDSVLERSPEGDWILFASDRSESIGIWAIRIAGGKVQGEAQLVKAGVPDIDPIGLTREGAFYYSYSPVSRDVYFAKLDPGTGRIVGTPEKAIQRFEGVSSYPAYSPDGRYLAYVCAAGPRGVPRGSASVVRIRSLETLSDREFSTEFARVYSLRWLPDGRAILFAGLGDNGTGIYQLDTQTGQVTTLLHDAPGVSLVDMDTSADGKAFFYVRLEKEKNLCRILLRDLESGNEKELYRAPAAEDFRISRSADGRWLAFLNLADNRVLRIIPANGGEPRELFRYEQKGNFQISPAWTADGRYILLSRLPDQKGNWDLWRVPVDGGQPEKVGLEKRCESISAHPNGRQIAFFLNEASINEVWVMENFLPGLKAAR